MMVGTLQEELMRSLKNGDTVRVETLRYLLAAVRNVAIAKYGRKAETELTDADVLDVVRRQVTSHKESIEAFVKGGRSDLVEKEKAQLAILQSYLPQQLSDEDLVKLLEPLVASGEKSLSAARQDFGLLMKQAMAKVAGQAENGRIAAMLKRMIVT